MLLYNNPVWKLSFRSNTSWTENKIVLTNIFVNAHNVLLWPMHSVECSGVCSNLLQSKLLNQMYFQQQNDIIRENVTIPLKTYSK